MATVSVTQLSLGDLFDRTFRLLGKTLPRSLPVALIALIPPGLLLTAGFDAFYSALGDLLKTSLLGAPPDMEALKSLLWTLAMTGLAGFTLLAGTVLARVGVTGMTCGEMLGQHITWKEALARASGFRFSRAMGQVMLEYLALGCLVGAGYVALIGSFASGSVIVIIGGLLLFLGAGMLAVFFSVRWSQTYAVIAWEGSKTFEAFRRSRALVETGWWRVLGILLLFGLLRDFAVGLITTPVSLFALWDFYRGYFTLLGSSGVPSAGPALMTEMFSSIGVGLGLTVILGITLSTVITPAYAAALYVDLRARNGEFDPEPPPGEKPEDLSPPDDLRFDDFRLDDDGDFRAI